VNRFILIHYSEIGLKKSNKEYFVRKLRDQIKYRLEQKFHETFKIMHILSRLFIPLEFPFDEKEYVDVLKKIFGIKNFQFVYEGSLNIEKLGLEIWENMPDVLKTDEVKNKSFCVRAKRSQLMETGSFESEGMLGEILLKKGIGMSVKMKESDFVFNVEFLNEAGYFSYLKYSGMGGMSGQSGDKLVSLISAGIDSPVASFRMMKRGARVIFAHFHAYPYTDMSEIDNVKKLVEILSGYQFNTRLFLLPFGDIQKKIATNLDIDPKIRVVLYRRFMLRIAEKIARKVKAKGLITGDSYAQVASQTAQNLFAIHDVTTIPLFQPLISFDKEDIVSQAKAIETFDISKLPCNDTCSMFSPEHPELKASVYDLADIEKNLPVEKWVNEVLDNAEIIDFT